jgi:hypothetical protein
LIASMTEMVLCMAAVIVPTINLLSLSALSTAPRAPTSDCILVAIDQYDTLSDGFEMAKPVETSVCTLFKLLVSA